MPKADIRGSRGFRFGDDASRSDMADGSYRYLVCVQGSVRRLRLDHIGVLGLCPISIGLSRSYIASLCGL